jgi:outer membrane lipoprotein LolB
VARSERQGPAERYPQEHAGTPAHEAVIGDNAGMKPHSFFRPAASAALALLLVACAATAPLSNAPVAAYRERIDINGRLSVNYEKDGKQDTISVKFAWAQTGERVDVDLASPLGQTVAKIVVAPGAATLVQSGKAPRTAADINALTADTLGWSLPVTGLRDWLQGYATAKGGARFAASPVNNVVQTSDGWQLTFVSWQDPQAAHPAPKRIDATRAATLETGELAIRIVIDAEG